MRERDADVQPLVDAYEMGYECELCGDTVYGGVLVRHAYRPIQALCHPCVSDIIQVTLTSVGVLPPVVALH